MKFITEDDLRDLYKKEPFMDYDLQPGERLTPGARQFLLDRGINLYDDDPFLNTGFKKSTSSKSSDDCEEKAAFDKQFAEKKHKWALAGLKAQLEDLYAQLENASEEANAQIEAAIEAIEDLIAEVEAAIEAIENAIDELQEQLAEAQKALEEAIAAVEAVIEAIKEAIENGMSMEEAMEKIQ